MPDGRARAKRRPGARGIEWPAGGIVQGIAQREEGTCAGACGKRKRIHRRDAEDAEEGTQRTRQFKENNGGSFTF